MMHRAKTMFRAKSLLACCLTVASSLAVPQPKPVNAGELMSPSVATQLGLEQAWRRQLRVAYGAQSIVDFQIYVSKSNPREYVEVVGPAPEGGEAPVMFRIATDQKDAAGQAVGTDEAQRLARREVTRMARRVPGATIRTTSVPRVYVYTVASNGTVDCRDAESGQPIWVSQVGNPELNYGKLGIDDQYISVPNGGNIILLDATDGREIDTKATIDVPLYGAINSGGFVLVPTIRKGVEGYRLSDLAEKVTTVRYMQTVEGLALEPLAKSPTSPIVSWGTDRGFVYFMDVTSSPSVIFRLDTAGIVSGRPAAAGGDRFFFASEGGQAYAVHATRLGDVLWSQPLGEPFYDTPFLLGDKVFVNSAYGNLFALSETSGIPVWNEPTGSVAKILGGIPGQLFVRLMSGHFASINVKDGSISHVVPLAKSDFLAINRLTDRLYVVDSRGVAQCLRPIGSKDPSILHPDDAVPEAAVEEETTPSTPAETNPTTDPFGAGGDNPFGGGAGADPFGAGGNDGGQMDDPFGAPAGGGGDPFGGDPFGN
ncbi:PQQ-like beta-propeller repeat protein [Stieleria sp. JC731]|nr:PQQ-binding-like beta-propeller repeat protein [Stieleria sp. JC731]MCC9602693.1 PQQ-like beta-propeller repeat protein [Stieleria sp. JC731]